MGLSCGYGGDGYDWYYEPPDDFEVLDTKRGRRCYSCKCQIKVGDTCAKFRRSHPPRYDVEEIIYGDQVPMAPLFMCEECGGLYFSLEDLGYNITLNSDESMRDLVAQHAEMQNWMRRERHDATTSAAPKEKK